MISNPVKRRIRPFWVALAVLVLTGPVRADLVFQVTVDTSGLGKSTAGYGAGVPYSLDLTLTGGTNTNTVTISPITLGTGGSDLGTSYWGLTGGASGSLSSGVTLTTDASVNANAGGFNDFNEEFTPGDTLAFTVDATTNYVSGTPDRFTFSILDSAGNPISTTDTGNNNEFALLGLSITGSGLSVSSVENYTTSDLNGQYSITPVETSPAQDTPAPEPSGLVSLCAGAVAVVGWYGLRSRSSGREQR